jgi:hypothetical protein
MKVKVKITMDSARNNAGRRWGGRWILSLSPRPIQKAEAQWRWGV